MNFLISITEVIVKCKLYIIPLKKNVDYFDKTLSFKGLFYSVLLLHHICIFASLQMVSS